MLDPTDKAEEKEKKSRPRKSAEYRRFEELLKQVVKAPPYHKVKVRAPAHKPAAAEPARPEL